MALNQLRWFLEEHHAGDEDIYFGLIWRNLYANKTTQWLLSNSWQNKLIQQMFEKLDQ